MQAFSTPTFRLLEGENGLKNHPDTVDDLFRLCVRFIQRSAVAFLQCSIINHIVNCALVACSLEHKDANSSVMNFFRELIKRSRIKEVSRSIPVVTVFCSPRLGLPRFLLRTDVKLMVCRNVSLRNFYLILSFSVTPKAHNTILSPVDL